MGTVLQRLGDVFGSTVNVASRLTTYGRKGKVYVDSAMAAALDGERDYRLRRAWVRPLPGVGLVEAWLLRRRG
jgi:adenylate cyclase